MAGKPLVPLVPKSLHRRCMAMSDQFSQRAISLALLLPVWVMGMCSCIFTALREGSHACPLTHFHCLNSKMQKRSQAGLPVPVPVAGSLPTRVRVPRVHLPLCCPAPFSHQLIWCVGSPSVWLYSENAALCLHQDGGVLLQFCTVLSPEK